MRIAHLIIAHKNPNQLLRLIKSLYHENFDFFIHIDAKVAVSDFQQVIDLPYVYFIQNRIKCNWGGFSLTKSIFNSISEVLNSGISYRYINLISAQDYPIRSSEYINDFLLSKSNEVFIAFDDSEDSSWYKDAAYRYERYHLTDFNFRGKYLVQRFLNKFAPLRKIPGFDRLYGNNTSCWWTLPSECAKDILIKFENTPKLQRFLMFCWGSDEFLIPTMIMHSSFKSSVKNNNFRFMDWSEGNAHPKLLTESDITAIMQSNMLFARKFDTEIDSAVLDMIDEFKSNPIKIKQ